MLEFKMFSAKKRPGLVFHPGNGHERADAESFGNNLVYFLGKNCCGDRIDGSYPDRIRVLRIKDRSKQSAPSWCIASNES